VRSELIAWLFAASGVVYFAGRTLAALCAVDP
jgi:hypothetical protein